MNLFGDFNLLCGAPWTKAIKNVKKPLGEKGLGSKADARPMQGKQPTGESDS